MISHLSEVDYGVGLLVGVSNVRICSVIVPTDSIQYNQQFLFSFVVFKNYLIDKTFV